jgi:hypothetical protein
MREEVKEDLKAIKKNIKEIPLIASEVQANRLERIITRLVILDALLTIGLVLAIIF